MKLWLAMTICAGVLFASVVPIAWQDTPVEIDVTVTDKNGAIADLRQDEIQVNEEGKKVEIQSFTAVKATGMSPAEARHIVIVLDDAGVPNAGTQALQQIATMFVQGAGPADRVSVIRLHNKTDELVGDQQTALARIAGFQAGAVPFFPGETTEDYLRLVEKLSKAWLETAPHRRKAIVCVGSPAVCGPNEREQTAPRDEYSTWLKAMNAAATSNVVAYAAIPARFNLLGGGLVERTGGEAFGGLQNFQPAVDQVYQDLSVYYMVSYVPPASKKDLKSIAVRVSRKGGSSHVRNRR